jgi:hypothetical protein
MTTEISLEPMEDNEELDKELENIELDKDVELELEIGKEKSLSTIKRDLSDYRKRMGNKATYKGWLAHIVPENLKLDKRLENIDNDYYKYWEESVRRLTRKRHLRNKRNQTGKKDIKDVKEN